MPTIYTENPTEFRTRMDALYVEMERAFRQIISDREASGTYTCTKCGATATIAEMRRGAGDAILCPHCLEGMVYCQLTNVYHPADQVRTYYDGSTPTHHQRPASMSAAGIASRGQNVYLCPKCGEWHYNGGVVLRKADGSSETICQGCAHPLTVHRCCNCNTLYELESQMENCCGNQLHYSHKDVTMQVEEGTNFTRFSKRPVGMEIETGDGGRKTSVYRWLNKNLPNWGAVSDGSLPSGGYEYVSNPMTGNKIEENYTGFASAMIAQEVEVEHQRAGYHVHVNAKDLYQHIERLYSTDQSKADKAELMLQDWGKAMIPFLKELVAPWRRDNHYCNGTFGYRSTKGSYPRYLRRAQGSGYPALAIRMETLEFRLFPSTGNMEWHLTRAEVAQKAVDFIYNAIKLEDRAGLDTFITTLRLHGAEKVAAVSTILGLSEEGSRHLGKIHHTWTPSEYSDGKAISGDYRKEPRPRKKRSDAGVSRGPQANPRRGDAELAS